MKRREFVGKTMGAAAASALASSRVLGANQRVRLGLIGCGPRGKLLVKLAREVPDVEIVAACDVYDAQLADAANWAGPNCRTHGDFRKLIEQKDLDAVFIATPDHWHAIQAVLACQAGLDVYVEKPLGHNVKEGRAIVEAGKRHKRLVAAGTQQRSALHYAEVARIIRGGQLGAVNYVRIWNFMNLTPEGIGRVPDSEPPAGLDWDFYLGPAPKVPFNKGRFLGTYRWFWDYAGGLATDFGTHRFDTMHQIMGVDMPVTVSAAGGRFTLRDGAETPDVLQATFEYSNFTFSYEGCMINAHGSGGRTAGKKYYQMRSTDDRPHGEAFYGTNGALFSDRIGYEVYPELKPVAGKGASIVGNYPTDGPRMERKEVAAEDATGLHVKNFIECIRTRQKPAADAETGQRSTNIGHLANIAFRTGRKLRWDGAKEEFPGDPEANKLLGREFRPPWDQVLKGYYS